MNECMRACVRACMRACVCVCACVHVYINANAHLPSDEDKHTKQICEPVNLATLQLDIILQCAFSYKSNCQDSGHTLSAYVFNIITKINNIVAKSHHTSVQSFLCQRW